MTVLRLTGRADYTAHAGEEPSDSSDGCDPLVEWNGFHVDEGEYRLSWSPDEPDSWTDFVRADCGYDAEQYDAIAMRILDAGNEDADCEAMGDAADQEDQRENR